MTLLHRQALARSASPVERAAPRGRDLLAVVAGAVPRTGTGPRTIVQRATRVSRAAALATVVAALVLPSWLVQHQVWVLAAGFLVGLPHGATDHLLPLRHRWVRQDWLGLVVVLIGYVGVAALAFIALRVAGPVALPLLLLLSIAHFGAADLTSDTQGDTMSGCTDRGGVRQGRGWRGHAAERFGGRVAAIGRGAPVVAGPLLAWPTMTTGVLVDVGLGTSVPPVLLTGVAVALLCFSVVHIVTSLVRQRWSAAVETVLLLVLFTVAPPLAAFGVYFGLWHALRHTARLIADDPANRADLDAGRMLRPLRRFAVEAAVPSAVALGTVVALVQLAAGHDGLVPPVFCVLLALTVPHVVIVARLDSDDRDDRADRLVGDDTASGLLDDRPSDTAPSVVEGDRVRGHSASATAGDTALSRSDR